MNKITLSISTVVFAVLLLGMFGAFIVSENAKASGGSTATQACTASSTKVFVGHQASTEVLQSKGRRAWALIQQPLNATNTVAVSVTSASPAFGSGISLASATTSEYKTSLEVGLNTDFAYTGAVTVLTSTGSSTLQITECIY